MATNSKIEWTHHTFNPWWGCEKISPGCANCYAAAFSHRLGKQIWGQAAPRQFFGDDHWATPLKWNNTAKKQGTRHRVFCASMADVFEDREDLIPHRQRLLSLIDSTPHLDWLLLTKRPENIHPLLSQASSGTYPHHWNLREHMPNIWLGTTAENQDQWDARLPHLLAIPAAIHFVSAEPLLGPINLGPHRPSWIITGGESGTRARPMHPQWAIDLRDQCEAASIPFLFKQWGDHAPIEDPQLRVLDDPALAGKWTHSTIVSGSRKQDIGKRRLYAHLQHGHTLRIERLGKNKTGRLLQGQTHHNFPTP